MGNQMRYNQEREQRWEMAKVNEPIAIKTICQNLSGILRTRVSFLRYDKIRFDQFKDLSLPENQWVKGAPDYVIRFGEPSRYLYSEIKIKNERFRKTCHGGITQAGSVISNYGCESFYLDIVPVYRNMCMFVDKIHLNKDQFIIFFASEDMREIRAITLQEIQDLIEKGYNSEPICIYSEGYGTITENGRPADNYLIPVDSTHEMNQNFEEYAWQHSADDFIANIFAHRNMYYHVKRDCKFIKNKPDGEITVFASGNAAQEHGYIMCKECMKWT